MNINGSQRTERLGPHHTKVSFRPIAILCLFAVLALSPQVEAATFTVTNLADSGPGTLRQAILDANTTGGDDTINCSVTDTIILGSELQMSTNIVINGPGADQLTVSGNNSVSVFNITAGTVEIHELTIADGNANNGGGIYNNGTLTVTRSIISGNRAGFGDGGGIYNNGTLTLVTCTLSDNDSFRYGGGLFNAWNAQVTMFDCSVSGNTARDEGGGGVCCSNNAAVTMFDCTVSDNQSRHIGGGILNFGVLTLVNCTVSGNTADDDGGGVSHHGNAALSNCTISGNTAWYGGGGGILIWEVPLVLNNCTLYGNTALGIVGPGSDASAPGQGGGVYVEEPGAFIVNNTLIAGNTAAASGPDVDGAATSNGYSLIGDRSGSTGFAGGEELTVPVGSVIDTSLRDNGGLTQTHAVVYNGPAIDGGNNADVPMEITTDQRGAGFPRIVDGDRNGTATVDIGAVEYGFPYDLPVAGGWPTALLLSVAGLLVLRWNMRIGRR